MVSTYFLLLTAILVIVPSEVTSISVHTPVGTITGSQTHLFINEVKTISKFMGIPYAETTAGANRWKKPIPKESFSSTYNADHDRPGCMQNKNYGFGFSEDCLHLNIYVPSATIHTGAQLPVMVWIHGGGFTAGTTQMYPADALCAAGNVIVVSMSYRLGVFGFMSTGTSEAKGNYGLWDQHLALKWVHNNIAAFGGDPNTVTIFGQSAGASSVLMQALYPGNSGLFQRVIAESGAPISPWAFTSNSNTGHVMQGTGCNTVDCLRNKSVLLLEYLTQSQSNVNYFVPTIDGEFFHENPQQILEGHNPISASARAFYSSLDILTGVNGADGAIIITSIWQPFLHVQNVNNFPVSKTEFNSIVLPIVLNQYFGPFINVTYAQADSLKSSISYMYTDWQAPNDVNKTRDMLLKLSSDAGFFVPAIRTINAHSKIVSAAGQTSSTYFYEFIYKPLKHTAGTPSWVKGPDHADEVKFVLGVPLVTPASGDTDVHLSHAVIRMWSNFAISGNPNYPKDITYFTHTEWPKYDITNQKYIEIDAQMTSASSKDHFNANATHFWTKTIPSVLASATSGTVNGDPQFFG